MNVLIVDDHALIREGIAIMVKALEPKADVWMANTCATGMEVASRQNMDFVFLDLQLPDQPGFQALERLRQHSVYTSVVVVSAQEDKATVMQAIDMGAKGFVPKSADSLKMRSALKALLEGRVYLPESILGSELPTTKITPNTQTPEWNLTERQKEVLALLLMGLSNKLIARKLNIVESTVKIHVSAILREMKVASRTQALVAVARQGMKLPLC